MKRKNILYLITACMVVSLVSCMQDSLKPSSDYMITDNVEYVAFSQIFSLQDKVKPDIDIVGVVDFAIKDTLLILTTRLDKGLWSFVSLPHYNKLGGFLNKGKGPTEFMGISEQ